MLDLSGGLVIKSEFVEGCLFFISDNILSFQSSGFFLIGGKSCELECLKFE